MPHAVEPSSPNHWTAGEFLSFRSLSWVFLVAQLVKNPPAMRETWFWEDPLQKGKATHSSILAWRIPWMLQSLGSQRAGHDRATPGFAGLRIFRRMSGRVLFTLPLLVSAAVVPVSSLL